ncbi:hypothetical protein WA538_006051 [Blastocystis sp. DL]
MKRPAGVAGESSKTMETEPGFAPRENVGRWDESEHKLFLEGLSRYGSDWKAIAGMISTRNLVQVRTHAQKYFQKLQKTNANKGFVDSRKRYRETVRQRTREEPVKPKEESHSPVSVLAPEVHSPPPVAPRVEIPVQKVEPKPEKVILVRPSVTPHSPTFESHFCETDFHLDIPKRGFGLSFDIESNNNMDDMAYFGCTEMHTPIFE